MVDQSSGDIAQTKSVDKAGSTAQPAVSEQKDKLAQIAQELAATLIADQLASGRMVSQARLPLLPYLKDYETLLLEAYQYFQGAAEERISLSYAAEWVLDNYYIIQQTIREIRENLPPGFYDELPIVEQGAFSTYPRIYALASEFISLEQYQLEIERLESFVEEFQSQLGLTMGELWALSSILRLVIVQVLVCAVTQLTGQQARLEIMQQERPFFRLQAAPDLANDDVVANCIISLRTLATLDWKDFFDATSLVERALGEDPAMIYSKMESGTRDRYRKAIGDLARVSGKGEREIAKQAIDLAYAEFVRLDPNPPNPHLDDLPTHDGMQESAEESSEPDIWGGLALPRHCHVGYFLIAEGRSTLEHCIGYIPPLSERMSRWVLAHPSLVYIGGITGLSLSLSFLLIIYLLSAGGSTGQAVIIGLLSLLLSSTAAVSFVNWVITNTVGPRLLPKLDFDEGIPANCPTMVVIPAMLTDIAEVDALVQQLELHYLRNPDPSLSFALLTDFADTHQEHVEGDEEVVNYGSECVRQLNQKYGREDSGPFLLLHRRRIWNPQEGVWMGWERKRGKLHELNRLILGDRETTFTHQVGDLSLLPTIRFVVTLDADTILPGQSARRLVAALAHPLNRAEFDPHTGRVKAGYTILQPRIEISPTSANKSLFTRIYSGDVGLDLYTLAVSDVYQDLFGEGIYIGKGIYDVENFERSLTEVVPENTLLSHDLFEGIHGRVGLITDVSLIEEYPHNYLVHMSRAHRWIRGDWQLLPWLLPRAPAKVPNHLTLIDRWKIFDNLRRSLVPPALLLFFLAGWAWFPGSPLLWTLAGIFSLAVPFLTSILSTTISGLSSPKRDVPLSLRTRPIRDDLFRWLLALTFLPYEAYIALDAIILTIVRLYVTHRNLLQWTTAARVAIQFKISRDSYEIWARMGVSGILAVSIGLFVLLVKPSAVWVALPLLTMWLLSPKIASVISRPIRWETEPLGDEGQSQLRALARRTWLYFEQYVGPEDHWLPPDHYQESPRGIIAHRTSPTNIGLSLLSTLAAYDFGYTGILELAARLNAAFENISKLETHRGHLLNWYDTRSLEPLSPRYVSTVDSGNLAGSLVALGQGCVEIGNRPILRQASCDGFLDTLDLMVELVEGLEQEEAMIAAATLRDTLAMIRQHIRAIRGNPQDWAPYLLRMTAPLPGKPIDESVPNLELLDQRMMEFVEDAAYLLGADTLSRLRIYSGRVRYHLESFRRKIEMLLPWAVSMTNPPALFDLVEINQDVLDLWLALQKALPLSATLSEVSEVVKSAQPILDLLEKKLGESPGPAGLVEEAQTWCAWLQERLGSAGLASKALWIGFLDLYKQCEQMVLKMDFGFLFDRHRQIFHIGYNVELGRLDANYYDLLASEARIASLIAIARGHVPQSHWLHLSRPFTQINGARVLLSWSATMFEYLMPDLLLQNYEGTLLYESSRAAVDHQIGYGEHKHVPWGISESSYYHFDDNQVYQYRAFGVPGLGFKRGLSEDLVISPYASLLALPLRPVPVLANLHKFKKLGMVGTFGLYEAVDFTSTRVGVGQDCQIVRSYMAHHQGMILLSLVNYFKKNIMVERFHADPYIRSVELLLQEQVPEFAPLEQPHAEDGRALSPEETSLNLFPWMVLPEPPQPRVHFLSNGRYNLMISSSGAGFSTRQGIALTRFQTDTSLNDWGTWIYVKEEDRAPGENALWSPALQPLGATGGSQDVLFSPHQVEFRRREHDISIVMEITVPSEDDLEIRRITLTNHEDRPRRLSLTSYGEVILAPMADDQRHPAFSKLFIESEYIADQQALLFRRRPRSAQEKVSFLAHSFVLDPHDSMESKNLSYETDRARFLGRGRTVRAPQALQPAREGQGGLSNTTGATLDPVMAIRYELTLEPHSTIQAAFITCASDSRQASLAVVSRYSDWHLIERAYDQARAASELELRRLGIDTPTLEKYQKVLSVLLYPHAALRAEACQLAANQAGQPTLWAHGISGDYPILLVKVGSQDDSSLVRDLLLAHVYWRSRGLLIDLVLLNMQGSDYGQELSGHLRRLIFTTDSESWINRRGGIFLVNLDRLKEPDLTLLETAARAVLDGEKGTLAEQLERLESTPTRLPIFVPSREQPGEEDATPPLNRPDDLRYDNGYGGFSQDGSEYVIFLEPGQFTPAPWVNVIANPDFGFLVSESGSGYTWSLNSGENRLTPWSNDPVSDPPGEALYFRDEETAEVWTPTPLPVPAQAPYTIRHRAGCSTFEHHSHGLKQNLRLFAAHDEPVKIIQVRLKNATSRVRRITATYFVEWVLGLDRETTQQYIIPEYDSHSQALLATNPYNTEFAERVAFLASDLEIHGLTADRTEFLGRLGSYQRPAALGRIGLTGRVEPGLDPCAVLQVHIDLQPGETKEFHFLLGQGETRQHAQDLVHRFQSREQVTSALTRAIAEWDRLLGAVQVRTPDPAMDLLLNRWLLYQSISCRIWGRSGFYQSSGAYGFRDQLQDVMSVIYADPEIARTHILRAARHQFEAGDVLHWWHPPSGRGVRTRYSDDLLWLPYVVAHYVTTTGDQAVLDEIVPYLQGPDLDKDEKERYGHYDVSRQTYSLYDHCCRALEKGSTTGQHHLPLMGAGDWNDGMNRVGIEGRGESVWLAWFLCSALERFADLAEKKGDIKPAELYRKRAGEYRLAIEEHAWDGEWYLRAFYDDGTPLGSSKNRECQIDSIAQSWAILSGNGQSERATRAMQAVSERLVLPEDRLLLLLRPPFDKTPRDPGYIKGYLPGIRENGGQYTHAALWAIWAYAKLGQGDYAGSLFRLINPIYHADSLEKIAQYKVEPYVIAADVYGRHPHTGRGGWTWYTGSAGWMYRLGLEALLGMQKEGDSLSINPSIPSDWEEYSIEYKHGDTLYQIKVENPAGLCQGVKQVILDGRILEDDRIPLVPDGGTHQVRIVMGERAH